MKLNGERYLHILGLAIPYACFYQFNKYGCIGIFKQVPRSNGIVHNPERVNLTLLID